MRTFRPPNILVILVDQLREPQHFSPQLRLEQYLPGLARLRAQSIAFTNHYTASNMCSPARGTMLTGLYSHQTAAFLTLALNGPAAQPGLNPGFPTWGTMLRDAGYRTWWWGKFHVTDATACDLTPWGFEGGTCPSPNGNPGQGLEDDPPIVDEFHQWLSAHGHEGPWCTTVSLINPHDIAWFPRYTDEIRGERYAQPRITDKPPNFETPEQLRRKPSLQRSLQELMAQTIGVMPFTGPRGAAGMGEDAQRLHPPAARRQPPGGARAAGARAPAGHRGAHDRRVHRRPRRVRRLARPA